MQVLESMYHKVNTMPGGRHHNQTIHTLVSILAPLPILDIVIIIQQDLLFTAALTHQTVM